MAVLFVPGGRKMTCVRFGNTLQRDNMDAADRLLARIDSRLDVLRHFPNIGTRRDDIRPGFRMLVEGYYLLLYDYDDASDEVDLVAVIDGRRDLSEMF